VWGTICMEVVRALGYNFACPFLIFPRFSPTGMSQTLRFGGCVTLTRTLWFLFAQADVLLVGKLLGKELLGTYSAGTNLAYMPMDKVSGIVNQVAFPAFSRIQGDVKLAGAHFLKSTRVMSFFAFPVLWGMSSVSGELVSVLLGGKWGGAILPLQLISLVVPFRMISNLMAPALLGFGRADVLLRNTLVSFLIIVPGMIVGTAWGISGICIAWVSLFPIVLVINYCHSLPVFSVKPMDALRSIRWPVAGAAVMYFAVVILRSLIGNSLGQVQQLLMLIMAGAISYIAVTLFFSNNSYQEVLRLMHTRVSE
jgi:teichuronic acid exporter